MRSSDGNTNVVVVNNNDMSAQHKEELLNALKLSQQNSNPNSNNNNSNVIDADLLDGNTSNN